MSAIKLTKYQHSCFTVEKNNEIIVVDPGKYSSDFIAPDNVVAIIITHVHSDHFDHEQIESIIDRNPEAVIFGPQTVTSAIEVFKTQTITEDTIVEVGQFKLRFIFGEHEAIRPNFPSTENLGIMIDDLLYYPGDSFMAPPAPVDTLALPVAAPWLKISDTIDFYLFVHPRLAFPTHDAILSAEGKEIVDSHLSSVAADNDMEYKRLDTPIEI
jgi:L-ascorbate metabolism protein UlaG (beta-lactamase superfamily)